MKNKEEPKLDKDGYILVPKVFTDKGYTLTHIEDLGEWKIYKRQKEGGYPQFELVRFKRNESFTLGDSIIPKKHSYPGSSSFGTYGFSCISLERARAKYQEIKNKKQDSDDKESGAIEIKISFGEFTVAELVKLNEENYKYPQIYLYVKELLKDKKVKIVGEKKNKVGKPSKIYKLA